MNRKPTALTVPIGLLLAFMAIGAENQQVESPPETGVTEKVEVNLLQVDVVVLDKKDRTLPGLTQGDFELTIEGKPASIDTFDVFCPAGALETSKDLEPGQARPLSPDLERKIVFAVDYNHLRLENRAPVLNQAQWMVENGKTAAEEIMVVSIADGLRIEQPFSRSKTQAVATLSRMEHDVTLWGREFGQGVTGKSYFDSLATLMDVMAQYDGTKAVVLLSELQTGGSRDWDSWFNDVAQRAANSQTRFYPAAAVGLSPGGAPPGLSRLANESGGRLTFRTNDLSRAYATAQTDLSCRYTLGHYFEPGEGRVRKSLRVYVRGEKEKSVGQVRYPEQVRMWTDDELVASTLRAAHADPGPFQNPLIRSWVYPVGPSSTSEWNAVVLVNFSLPVPDGGVDIDVSATLLTGTAITQQYKGTRFHVDPAPGGKSGTRMVTMMGEGSVKPGEHRLDLVLHRPGDEKPHTTQAMFGLPEVPREKLFVNGPFLGRAVPEGVLLRARNEKSGKREGPTALEEIVGPGATFEPLLVYRIEPRDKLLVAWTACIVDGQLPADAEVERNVLDEAGKVVHRLDARKLDLPNEGKVRCHAELDSLPGGTLAPGDYTIAIRAKDGSGKDLVSKTVPLLVE